MESILKNVAAVPDMKGAGADERYPTLGNLVWYSLRDVRIKREELAKLFSKHGISHTHLPPEIRAPDAYRRATSDINQRQHKPLPDGTFEVLMVREVASTGDEIVRHLISEIRDSKNKKLSYEQVGTLIFRRDNEDYSTHALKPEVEQIIKESEANFKEYLQYYTGKHIREMVHGMVMGTLPVNVRPGGGVFFISKNHEALVSSLEGLVAELNQYKAPNTYDADGIFESVPVLDLEKQRKLIFDKYESQCAASVDGTLQELAELLKGGKAPTKSVLADYVDRMKDLKEGIGKYEALLEKDLTIARMKCQLLQEQVKALLDKAATPPATKEAEVSPAPSQQAAPASAPAATQGGQ